MIASSILRMMIQSTIIMFGSESYPDYTLLIKEIISPSFVHKIIILFIYCHILKYNFGDLEDELHLMVQCLQYCEYKGEGAI